MAGLPLKDLHRTTETNEKDTVISTTGTWSVAHGLGMNGKSMNDSHWIRTWREQSIWQEHASLTDTGSEFTSDNIDQFTRPSTNEQLSGDDTSQAGCLEFTAEKARYDAGTIRTKVG